MVNLVDYFNYVELEKETDDEGVRRYKTPNGENVPSVTTILSDTKDKTALKEWRLRVGEQEANRIARESSNIGSLLHEHIENYILGKERPGGTNIARQMAKDMSDKIINEGLLNVSEVWGIEKMLYFPGLYAGTADMIGVYDGKPAIMDHKNTRKPKKEEWIEDYYCQLVAYAMAHNELYNTNIKCGVIFMVSMDNEYQEWVLEGEKFEKYMYKWIERLENYYNMK